MICLCVFGLNKRLNCIYLHELTFTFVLLRCRFNFIVWIYNTLPPCGLSRLILHARIKQSLPMENEMIIFENTANTYTHTQWNIVLILIAIIRVNVLSHFSFALYCFFFCCFGFGFAFEFFYLVLFLQTWFNCLSSIYILILLVLFLPLFLLPSGLELYSPY